MADTQNPYLGASNPYLNANIDASLGDMTRQYNLTQAPAFNSAMVNSGSFGNAGVQQMAENGQRNLSQAQGNVSAGMRMQDFQNQQQMYQWDQGFNRQNAQWDSQFANQKSQWDSQFNRNNSQWDQQFARNNAEWDTSLNRGLYNDAWSQNNQNLQTGMGLLNTMNGYNQQNLQQGNAIQNTPMDYWSQFSNAANGLGQGFGTSTQKVGTTSSPIAGAIGGAQLGNAAMNWWNTGGGNNISQANQNSFDSFGASNGNWWGTGS